MQTITVEIDNNSHVMTKEGISKKGAPYSFKEQSCIVHGAGRFPQETRVRVPDGQQPYPVGTYEVHNLVQVGRYGFEISRDYYLTQPSAKPAAKVA